MAGNSHELLKLVAPSNFGHLVILRWVRNLSHHIMLQSLAGVGNGALERPAQGELCQYVCVHQSMMCSPECRQVLEKDSVVASATDRKEDIGRLAKPFQGRVCKAQLFNLLNQAVSVPRRWVILPDAQYLVPTPQKCAADRPHGCRGDWWLCVLGSESLLFSMYVH